jgi:hypothetical protein
MPAPQMAALVQNLHHYPNRLRHLNVCLGDEVVWSVLSFEVFYLRSLRQEMMSVLKAVNYRHHFPSVYAFPGDVEAVRVRTVALL